MAKQEDLWRHVCRRALEQLADVCLFSFHLMTESKVTDLGQKATGLAGTALQKHIARLRSAGQRRRCRNVSVWALESSFQALPVG